MGGTIAQLKELRRRAYFTATRVGEPGCGVRLDAQADVDALDEAIRAVEIASDPKAIHVNMLSGRLARPSVRAIKHIYGSSLDAPDA